MTMLEQLAYLAAPPEVPPEKGPEFGKAAPIGLLIIVVICVIMGLLMRSMVRHIRRANTRLQQPTGALVEQQPDGYAVAQCSQRNQGVEELVVAEDGRPADRSPGGVKDGANAVTDTAEQNQH